MDQRLADFASNGVERVLMIPFTHEVSMLTPTEFVDSLVRALQPVDVIVGEDFRFGHDRAGSAETLTELGASRGFTARALELVPDQDGEKISTTRIRALINDGSVAQASELLGRNHRVAGHVVHGDKFGARMGYPTANVAAEGGTCIPSSGIYAGRWHQPGEPVRDGVVYIGDRSTVSDAGKIGVEIHIFDFDGDLYGVTGEVEFVSRIRADQHFESVEALVAQMDLDAAEAKVRLRGG